MVSPRNYTATEVDEAWNEWWRKWREAEARLIEPILDKILELARAHGTKA